MTEAVAIFTEYAFIQFGLVRIYAIHMWPIRVRSMYWKKWVMCWRGVCDKVLLKMDRSLTSFYMPKLRIWLIDPVLFLS